MPRKLNFEWADGVLKNYQICSLPLPLAYTFCRHVRQSCQLVLTSGRTLVKQHSVSEVRAEGCDHTRVVRVKLSGLRHGFEDGSLGMGMKLLVFAKCPMTRFRWY